MSVFRRLWKADNAQDVVEYSLLLAVVAFGTAGLMYSSGGSITGVWTSANATLNGNPATAQTQTQTQPTTPPSGSTTTTTTHSSRDGDGHH